MSNKLNPLALIVGGSSGMGFATAKQLLERGIDVAIIGSSAAKLESAKSELLGLGNVESIQANLYRVHQHLNRSPAQEIPLP